MADLTYHLESESLNGKNHLVIRCRWGLQPVSKKESLLSLPIPSKDKTALEFLIKEHGRSRVKMSTQNDPYRFDISSARSFDVLKSLGATGKLFYQDKKVVLDPFQALEFYFQAERQISETVQITGFCKMGNLTTPLHECDLIFPANPSWIIHDGIIRAVKDEIASKWIELASSGPQSLTGPPLSQFLMQVEEQVSVIWKGDPTGYKVEPMPLLRLQDRHGGFADLWFDYGHHGKIAAHDPTASHFRSRDAEKNWEKDLLESDFIKKIVDHSHYYCPLDRVAKSLTFLLEIGWTILDSCDRKVLRQSKVDFDAAITPDQVIIRAKMHYDEHRVDLKDLVGAFNRRENFVEISPQAVALLDRDHFSGVWEDFTEQEIITEGIRVKKNHFGLLTSLFEKENFPVRENLKKQIEKMARLEPSSPIQPSQDFTGTLFSYQNEGLQWLKFLEEGKFGGLLADEMGLGKTVQVLAFFSCYLIRKPCLIIVPTSLMFNWQREIEKFLPTLPLYRYEGKDRDRSSLEKNHVILTSYALFRLDADVFQQIDYQIVVLDEGQTIKNPDSQIAKACFGLKSQMRLVITGTPIENRLEDLWALFHFLLPDLLGERRPFQQEMLAAQSDGRYLERIKKKIRPFILRRKKSQVALQLPPKLEQTVFVDMTDSQRTIYEQWLQNTKKGLLKKIRLSDASSHRMEILEAILRLRQLCCHPWLVVGKEEIPRDDSSAKFERLMSDLQEVVEEKSKVLVYSQFTQMLHLMEQSIKEKGWKYVYLDGSSHHREEIVRQFQEDPETPIFLISLKAGGVGLNLTAADYVFLYDPWWNEAAERQAIDRAHRLGKMGTVIARRYVTALSIEEKIMRLKTHKTTLSQNLLDDSSEQSETLSLEDLLNLLD